MNFQRPLSPACTAVALMWLIALLSMPLRAELTVAQGSGSAATVGPAGSIGDPSDWTYTLKTGESFDQIARELLKASTSAGRLASYNRLDSPSSLRAGDQIHIPVAWLRQQPEPALVRGISGHARVRSAGNGAIRPLTEGQRIQAGDTIITHNGMATVELADGSTIRINPGSSVVFNRLTRYGRAGMTDTRMRLERGGVSNRINPMIEEGARFEIETPSAVAAVRGTTFSLQADRDGSHLQVTEGRVAFGTPGNIREIPSGYGASVRAGGSGKMKILRLPPAPKTNPIPDTIKSMPAQLSWQANGARQYQVDILDQKTGQPVRSEQTSNTSFALGGLANGDYRAQVASLSNEGISGMPADVTFQVDLAARAAELLEPAPGATLDSDRPSFSWRYQGESERARVEIAKDSSFTDVVASSDWRSQESGIPNKPLKPGEYHWRVVTEAGGNSVATSKTRTLTINGTLAPVSVISANYIDRQVRIFWERNRDASGYLLQLSEDPSFEDVIKEATVDDTTAALRLIPGRRYFVRLRAISEGPIVGRWGPGRELYVE
ncbi:FecR domain-containing protein [Marinobacter lacisalsi]|uniref:FecR domain-containing protein n=1 Tax=Marinobacter lacisalsi TaxID=475979 RepID=A0ABV8QIZ4_9GAMM